MRHPYEYSFYDSSKPTVGMGPGKTLANKLNPPDWWKKTRNWFRSVWAQGRALIRPWYYVSARVTNDRVYFFFGKRYGTFRFNYKVEEMVVVNHSCLDELEKNIRDYQLGSKEDFELNVMCPRHEVVNKKVLWQHMPEFIAFVSAYNYNINCTIGV